MAREASGEVTLMTTSVAAEVARESMSAHLNKLFGCRVSLLKVVEEEEEEEELVCSVCHVTCCRILATF